MIVFSRERVAGRQESQWEVTLINVIISLKWEMFRAGYKSINDLRLCSPQLYDHVPNFQTFKSPQTFVRQPDHLVKVFLWITGRNGDPLTIFHSVLSMPYFKWCQQFRCYCSVSSCCILLLLEYQLGAVVSH